MVHRPGYRKSRPAETGRPTGAGGAVGGGGAGAALTTGPLLATPGGPGGGGQLTNWNMTNKTKKA